MTIGHYSLMTVCGALICNAMSRRMGGGFHQPRRPALVASTLHRCPRGRAHVALRFHAVALAKASICFSPLLRTDPLWATLLGTRTGALTTDVVRLHLVDIGHDQRGALIRRHFVPRTPTPTCNRRRTRSVGVLAQHFTVLLIRAALLLDAALLVDQSGIDAANVGEDACFAFAHRLGRRRRSRLSPRRGVVHHHRRHGHEGERKNQTNKTSHCEPPALDFSLPHFYHGSVTMNRCRPVAGHARHRRLKGSQQVPSGCKRVPLSASAFGGVVAVTFDPAV